MQVFPLGLEVVPWSLSQGFCSKSQELPLPMFTECWRKGRLLGFGGLPSPRLQKAGGRAYCQGPGRGAGVLATPPAGSALEGGRRGSVRCGLHSLWAPPSGEGALGWPLALLGELVQPVCFRRSLCRGGGGGCSPGGPPAAAVRQFIRNVSQ